jgi:uncharacterized protein YeaO (DUF488 family)
MRPRTHHVVTSAPDTSRLQRGKAEMPDVDQYLWSARRRESIMLSVVAADVRVKRIYDQADAGDGYRVLIDHVWPRGVSRERARLDDWARELAPSDELRRWFAHDPARFDEFRERYRGELAAERDRLLELARRAREGPVTILFAARDREHNNAVVLAELLRDG